MANALQDALNGRFITGTPLNETTLANRLVRDYNANQPGFWRGIWSDIQNAATSTPSTDERTTANAVQAGQILQSGGSDTALLNGLRVIADVNNAADAEAAKNSLFGIHLPFEVPTLPAVPDSSTLLIVGIAVVVVLVLISVIAD